MRKMCMLLLLLVMLVVTLLGQPVEAKKIVADFPISKQLVETGDDEHQIYYGLDDKNRRCLIYVCHGAELSDGTLAVKIDGQLYKDYVGAVEASIQKHAAKGELNGANFDAIYLFCCHIGLGNMNEWSKTFNCPFIHTLKYKSTVYVQKRFSKTNPDHVIGLEFYTAENRSLNIINKSGKEIYGVYCKPSDTGDWKERTADFGKNLLQDGKTIRPGESYAIPMNYDVRYCDCALLFRNTAPLILTKIDADKLQFRPLVQVK